MESEVIASIVTSGVSLIIAFISWLTSFLYKRSANKKIEAAVSDNLSERLDTAFIECPDCHHAHKLQDLEISFPPVAQNTVVSFSEVLKNGEKK